ncbi:MAG TPA: hypothetical protein VF111_04670 [Thermoanaerobaculia bacterium]
MTKKRLSLIAVAAHLVVAAIAISADVAQPPRERTWLPLLGGYAATALILTVTLYLGNTRFPTKAARAGMSLLLGFLFSGFLWIATFSVYLLSVLLYRRI